MSHIKNKNTNKQQIKTEKHKTNTPDKQNKNIKHNTYKT